MRVLLFDIDGTLIQARGAGHRSLVRAMRDVFGTAGAHDGYDWRGKTDPQIVCDLMREAGVSEQTVATGLAECFDRYVHYLEDTLANGHRVDVLPGIASLLAALETHNNLFLGLLTGNVEQGAYAKLRPTSLLPFFRVGAYGSDDHDRRRLPAIALRRVRSLTGRDIGLADLTIIGDTPLDVDCARACGARVVAVATGQHTTSDLAACNPDSVFTSFADVEAALRSLTKP